MVGAIGSFLIDIGCLESIVAEKLRGKGIYRYLEEEEEGGGGGGGEPRHRVNRRNLQKTC